MFNFFRRKKKENRKPSYSYEPRPKSKPAPTVGSRLDRRNDYSSDSDVIISLMVMNNLLDDGSPPATPQSERSFVPNSETTPVERDIPSTQPYSEPSHSYHSYDSGSNSYSSYDSGSSSSDSGGGCDGGGGSGGGGD